MGQNSLIRDNIEREIDLDNIDPIDIFGITESKLDILKSHFPSLKIVSRGHTLKAIGTEKETLLFENIFTLIIAHFHHYNSISEVELISIIKGNDNSLTGADGSGKGVLLFGNSGKPIKARTPNQRELVKVEQKSDLMFAVGPAGSGKTYTAIALAVKALKNREVRKIVLSRPAVEAGENLGFLPGDLKEKIDPYLQPLYDALRDMITPRKLEEYIKDEVIEIAPLAFMRGRTLSNCYVILDEAQNTTIPQLKMFLTRMGEHTKYIITGDMTQIDLPKRQPSGLKHAMKILDGVKGIEIVEFDKNDIIRHQLVKDIVDAYSKYDEESESKNYN